MEHFTSLLEHCKRSHPMHTIFILIRLPDPHHTLRSRPCPTDLLTYLITYFVTPWSRVLLEKLTGSAASQELPRFFWKPKVHHRTHKRPQMQIHSTCFWRFLRPSSGVLKTVVAATDACHGSGWCISSKDDQGGFETCRVNLQLLKKKQYCPKLHLFGSVYYSFSIYIICIIDLWWTETQIYEGWNFNSGNYLFTTDTKYIHVSKFYCPSM